MIFILFFLVVFFVVGLAVLVDPIEPETDSPDEPLTLSRRDYYRNVYLKSDDWQRKRYVVLRRDHWKCVYCGAPATQVHHTRYARKNIGKEPIDWLVSVCKNCHEEIHHKH